ncbi:nucleosome assembly protein 1-like 1 isoform X2 [Octopus bimaculoides]|uniref:nucleosome assembly protein 1-like 1 isoform X2 n=1 Tax=Octopus bimaculoides TaxID=37653 RepID=UPI0022E8474C|nr:nucleosome assembly protein 1-like 1 isoform X2 [Octopus bimaculoides]
MQGEIFDFFYCNLLKLIVITVTTCQVNMADNDPQNNAEADPEEVETDVDEGSEDAPQTGSTDVACEWMQNPFELAALQDKLGSLIGTPSTYIQSLPKCVKRRIKALKKLQFETTKIESDFYEELHSLECKFAEKYAPFYDKRKDIVNANVEPTDEECDWSSDEELADDMRNKAAVEDKPEQKEPEVEVLDENTKGIPHFWLTVFKNVDILSEMVQEHDEPILKHLIDIKCVFSEKDPMGFTLQFYFEPNDYIKNSVLTKKYIMKSEPDVNDPFSFEGPEIIKCVGCPIEWKKGKDVTVKVLKKKLKHKGRGTTRTVTKTVEIDSFFNFFNPPTVPADESELDENAETILATDFEVGHFIRERIIPKAVLYFTGEALEEDEDYEEEGDEEESDQGKKDCKQQ